MSVAATRVHSTRGGATPSRAIASWAPWKIACGASGSSRRGEQGCRVATRDVDDADFIAVGDRDQGDVALPRIITIVGSPDDLELDPDHLGAPLA